MQTQFRFADTSSLPLFILALDDFAQGPGASTYSNSKIPMQIYGDQATAPIGGARRLH